MRSDDRINLGREKSRDEIGKISARGKAHDPTKEHDALGHSVVDRPDPGVRLRLRPATRTPNGPEPLSDGDRGCRSGAARADELHAGGEYRDFRPALCPT